MDPSLCEFFAENELIRIVPNFNDRTVHLFCGDFGPFEAGAPVTVPFWLAMLLKRRRKCTIIPPDWLSVDELKRMIVAEAEQRAFAPIPECFFELSNLLMLNAREDVEQYEQLKTLVKDLWDKREAKMRTSTIKFLGQYEIGHAQLDNLTRMEICCARATLIEGSKQLDRLTATLHSSKTDKSASDQIKSHPIFICKKQRQHPCYVMLIKLVKATVGVPSPVALRAVSARAAGSGTHWIGNDFEDFDKHYKTGLRDAVPIAAFWKKFTAFVMMPLLVFGAYCGWKDHQNVHHSPRPEYIAYEYLATRRKPFPWGDGNHSFLHNPATNWVPGVGYEAPWPGDAHKKEGDSGGEEKKH
ncbi:hypothetical protein niasHT_024677 [Heterodera trifolii]|uniref:Probable DNA replication complex GINS protein PSF2 n=1 Tax=Heterodera trifolii TaxID=157864 RepID=A0ABD2K7T5_9BILA